MNVVILTNLVIPSKILLKLANSENAQKLINLVEILTDLVVLSRSPKSEKHCNHIMVVIMEHLAILAVSSKSPNYEEALSKGAENWQ